MKTKKILTFGLSLLISAIALWFALYNVRLKEAFLHMGNIHPLAVILSSAVVVCTFFGRALRWKLILKSTGNVGFMDAYHPLVIGFSMNLVLPGRIGEVARPVILKTKTGVPFATGFATVAMERFFDLIMLLLIFSLVFSRMNPDPSHAVRWESLVLDRKILMEVAQTMIRLTLLLILCIFLLSMERVRNRLAVWLEKIPGILFFLSSEKKELVQKKIISGLIRFMEGIANGFSLVKNIKDVVACFALSALIWSAQVFSYFIMAWGAKWLDIGVFQVAAQMVITCFAISLPSVPGFWGLWEAGGVFALSLFGINPDEAMGFTLAIHLIQIIPVFILGIVSAWITGVGFFSVSCDKNAVKPSQNETVDE